MKKMIMAALAAVAVMVCPAPATAQTQDESTKALESAHWYVPLSYGGFDFEIPAGSIVQKDSKMLVKYPDGSFGVSMENESVGLTQKIAFEKARMYATKYKLTDPKVEKVTVGNSKGGTPHGARAKGMLENHEVTVLILPVNDQQVTTVIMATPNRQEWANHFVNSMKN